MLIPKFSVMAGFMLILITWACQRNAGESGLPFETIPVSFPVNNNIREASGMAGSKANPGYLWVNEDGGAPAQLLLLKNDGVLSNSVFIKGADNIDWEDMALAKGPVASLNYIYLADIGDNLLARPEYAIYRFPEPVLTTDTVDMIDRIRFQYPDGTHDAEAILVDNGTKDVYVITKSDNPSHIYKIPYPQSVSSVNQAVSVGQLSFGGVTGAAISPDGTEIIIKTYPALSYFVRTSGQKLEESLKKAPLNLAYQLEPQGEAVAFAADNSGFYTLSEKAFSSVVNLYFYKRK
jgi:hypothetical protein